MNNVAQTSWKQSVPRQTESSGAFQRKPKLSFDLPKLGNTNTRYFVAGTAAFFALLSGSTSADGQRSSLSSSLSQQTSPVPLVATRSPRKQRVSAPDMLNEIRLLSGLTWEQISQVFQVSRRAIHSWASGGKLRSKNKFHLIRVHQEVLSLPDNQIDVRKHLFEKYDLAEQTMPNATQSAPNPSGPILEADAAPLKYEIIRIKSYKRKMRDRA